MQDNNEHNNNEREVNAAKWLRESERNTAKKEDVKLSAWTPRPQVFGELPCGLAAYLP
jgi:hypothetical protein